MTKFWIGTQPQPEDRRIIEVQEDDANLLNNLPRDTTTEVEVVDLLSNEQLTVRRADCGLPGCLCALELVVEKTAVSPPAELETANDAGFRAEPYCDACRQHKPCSCDQMAADRATPKSNLEVNPIVVVVRDDAWTIYRRGTQYDLGSDGYAHGYVNNVEKLVYWLGTLGVIDYVDQAGNMAPDRKKSTSEWLNDIDVHPQG